MKHSKCDQLIVERKKRNQRNHKRKVRLMVEAERMRFEAKIKKELPKLRIAYAAWANALETPPFGSGEYTWQLTVTFPFKILKDYKMKRFWEEIENAFEKIFFS